MSDAETHRDAADGFLAAARAAPSPELNLAFAQAHALLAIAKTLDGIRFVLDEGAVAVVGS